jgi:hypothetical protein
LSTISCVYFIGLRKSERDFVNHFILNKIRKWYH